MTQKNLAEKWHKKLQIEIDTKIYCQEMLQGRQILNCYKILS